MGKVKELWQQEIDKIWHDLNEGIITRDEAIRRWRDRGIDEREAQDWADEAEA